MTAPSIPDLIAVMRSLGHVVFDGARQPNLNLVVLRSTPGTLDAFDDLLVCFHRPPGGIGDWRRYVWRCTADPGKPAIDHPKRRDGTAVVAEGQHRAAYQLGTHHPGTPGAYECLNPARPIPVLRYPSAADYAAGRGTPSTSDSTQIHHARAGGVSTVVGPWSEGCIVLADDVLDYPMLMGCCHAQIAAGLGGRFTLTVMRWPPGIVP